MKQIDLHVHSTGSDGTLSPTELVLLAKESGLSAMALTDHDSVFGVAELFEAGAAHDLEVIAGVELSTEYADEEIHVVGLFIDPENEALNKELAIFRDNRDNRNIKMVEKLQEIGFDISAEILYKLYPDSVIARPHMARYLVETGQAPDRQFVFDNYIADGCCCYVERYKITPMRAVELIHEAGGIAILAHPCIYKLPRQTLLAMIGEMKAVGLDGIEALYSLNKGNDEADYRAIAAQFGLLLSGGSDFHGANKPHIRLGSGQGDLFVPYDFLEKMKTYRAGAS